MRSSTYRDRQHAGEVLAERLAPIEAPCVVVAIPRGGAIVGEPIAQRLGCPMTLAFVRKVALPESPELAIGALDEAGPVFADRRWFASLARDRHAVERACEAVREEIRRQRRVFPVAAIESFLPRSTVVLVDDGIATGETMLAAIARVRRLGARRIVVAAPCASVEAARAMEPEADDFVCPSVDPAFLAVGSYYDDFTPVSDAQVREALARCGAAATARGVTPIPPVPAQTGTGTQDVPAPGGGGIRRTTGG